MLQDKSTIVALGREAYGDNTSTENELLEENDTQPITHKRQIKKLQKNNINTGFARYKQVD